MDVNESYNEEVENNLEIIIEIMQDKLESLKKSKVFRMSDWVKTLTPEEKTMYAKENKRALADLKNK